MFVSFGANNFSQYVGPFFIWAKYWPIRSKFYTWIFNFNLNVSLGIDFWSYSIYLFFSRLMKQVQVIISILTQLYIRLLLPQFSSWNSTKISTLQCLTDSGLGGLGSGPNLESFECAFLRINFKYKILVLKVLSVDFTFDCFSTQPVPSRQLRWL